MIQKSHLALLVRYLKPQWRRMLLMTTLLVGSIAFQAAGPQALRRFIDLVSRQAAIQELVRTALVFLAVVVTGQAVSALATYASAVVGWEATNRLRKDLALHALHLDMRFHHAHLPGEMVQRINSDVGLLGNFFSQFVVQVAANGVLVLAALGLIFREFFLAGLVLMAYLSLAFLVLLRVQKIGRESFGRSVKIQSQAVGFWEEMLVLREDVKPIGATNYVLRRNVELEQAMLPEGRRSTMLFRLYVVAFAAVFTVGNAITFAVGAYLYGKGQATIGGVFLLLSYTSLLANKIGYIANQSNDFQQAVIAIQRVSELMDMPNPLADGTGAPEIRCAPAVHFENVSFAYATETPVLHDLSFFLGEGQKLGLLGRTGSGKSTIVRLLFRFYDPDSGAIRLDGADLRHRPLEELRRVVGMVTQDVQIFHATTRDNLTLFDSSLPDEKVLQVLDSVGLGAWLASLPDGLDTILSGDAGLSAGEAQLLAFARVFLQEPHLVILDEATSRLDPATGARLEQVIDRLLTGRTAIVIAHRLDTLRRMDQLLVLDGGCMVEYGHREDLEADPGSTYNRLLRIGLEILE